MNITCASCGTHYRIPLKKMVKEVSKATCKKCGVSITVRRPDAAPGDHLEMLRTEDEAVVMHSEDCTVITQVPELKDYQMTPALDTSAFSSMGIPVRLTRRPDAPASGETRSPANAVTRGSTSARIEAELFASRSPSNDAIYTVEAEDNVELDEEIPSDEKPVYNAASSGPSPVESVAVMGSQKPLTQNSVALPAGAKMVGDMSKSIAAAAASPATPKVSDVVAGTDSATAAKPALAATPAVDGYSGYLSPAMRKTLTEKKGSKGSSTAATSMHMGLTAQYESMLNANGLPPGFTTPVANGAKGKGGTAAKGEGDKKSMARATVPVQQSMPAAPPTKSEKVARMVAGGLSFMAFFSVVLVILQGN